MIATLARTLSAKHRRRMTPVFRRPSNNGLRGTVWRSGCPTFSEGKGRMIRQGSTLAQASSCPPPRNEAGHPTLQSRLDKAIVWIVIASVGFCSQVAGQPAIGPIIPNDLTEAALIGKIRTLRTPVASQSPLHRDAMIRMVRNHRTLAYVNALLDRFPHTPHREEAIKAKLATLAELARTGPEFLDELLALTGELSAKPISKTLASENAYYAIQAFVLGARREKMEKPQRITGTMERYEAFLEDYPDSPHRPVVWASLIRIAASLNEADRAVAEFKKLRDEFPQHAATRRAAGEVYRITGVGKSFGLRYRTPDGQTVNSRDYLGKVLVIHFWATWSHTSMAQLPRVIKLYKDHKAQGLQLIGINIDKDRQLIDEAMKRFPMPWPQYFDQKGFENDILIASGVVRIPTYLIVDRQGYLQAVDSGDRLESLVFKLLDESTRQRPTPPTDSSGSKESKD